MKNGIESILNELYEIDPSLRGREEELKRAAEELLSSRPEAALDESFEKDLRSRLLSSFPERKAAAKSGAAATRTAEATRAAEGGRSGRGSFRTFAASPAFRIATGALAACLVLALSIRLGPSLRSPEAEPLALGESDTGAVSILQDRQAGAEADAARDASAQDSAAIAEPKAAKPKAADKAKNPGVPAQKPGAAGPGESASASAVPAPQSGAVDAERKVPTSPASAAGELESRSEAALSYDAPLPAQAPQASKALTRSKDAVASGAAAGKLAEKRDADAFMLYSDETAFEPEGPEGMEGQASPAYKDMQAVQLANRDFNTEGYDPIVESSFAKAIEEPLSTFSIDVDTASYANVRRYIEGGSLPPMDAVRIEELINYFSYDYPEPEAGEPFAFHPELAYCPWNPDHLLLRVALQSKRIPAEELPPSNLVFLIDVSGSMEDENKLPLVKESLKMLARGMRPQDRIAVAVYAGAAGLVLPSTPGIETRKIEAALNKLEAGGSTAGGEGIELAYEVAKKSFMKQGNNRVIIATDGDFNVGASSDGELVRLIEKKRAEGIFLTVLGFGMGNYKDSKMQKLADSGNGNYAYVDSLSEAEKVLSRQMAGTLYAVAKDVKVQIEFNPALVGEYRLIGYEKRALAARDFADDTKDAGELGAGSSVTALYEIIPATGASARSELKYQSAAPSAASSSGELMTIKFRYKKPTQDTSILREKPVTLEPLAFAKASADFRFATTVAEWGLLLRDSKYKGQARWKDVVSQAAASRGRDEEGYRSEFLKLARLSETLAKKAR